MRGRPFYQPSWAWNLERRLAGDRWCATCARCRSAAVVARVGQRPRMLSPPFAARWPPPNNEHVNCATAASHASSRDAAAPRSPCPLPLHLPAPAAASRRHALLLLPSAAALLQAAAAAGGAQLLSPRAAFAAGDGGVVPTPQVKAAIDKALEQVITKTKVRRVSIWRDLGAIWAQSGRRLAAMAQADGSSRACQAGCCLLAKAAAAVAGAARAAAAAAAHPHLAAVTPPGPGDAAAGLPRRRNFLQEGRGRRPQRLNQVRPRLLLPVPTPSCKHPRARTHTDTQTRGGTLPP